MNSSDRRMRAISKTMPAAFAALAILAGPSGAAASAHAPAPQAPQRSCGAITVAAASDLTDVMDEIVANFEKATGCTVRVSAGSSGNFLSQIENGAPFDLFFSADIAYPKKLESEGLAAPGSTYLYAVGKIVLWVRNDSSLNVGKGLSALRDPAVRKISIANPQHAPYGRAAEEALRKSGIYDVIRDRLVLGENISQTAQFVESGNADAGILALSLALSPELKDKGRYFLIPENLYAPIEQGVVVLRRVEKSPGRATVPRFHQESRDGCVARALRIRSARQGEALNWQAIALSLKLAVSVAAILLAAGLPIAYWVTFSRWRWKFVIEAIVSLPIVLPPTVLGYYILVGLGPRNLPGKIWQAWFGHTLPFTFGGLLVASVLYSLPFAVQPFSAGFENVDRRLIEASWTLGASRLETFFRVILPLSAAGAVTGTVLSFAHTIGEFGVVLMVGGNIPGVTRTVSIDIYDQMQASNYDVANRTALVLLLFSFLVLSVIYGTNRRALALWRKP